MQIFLVGGALRDSLLRKAGRDIAPADRDWVVVGATPEEMIRLGFKPVGKDFPVFLHPETHEEYALARTERKTTHGYHGFTFYTAPSVTIEEDLARRDLTINAIAQDAKGTIIDPFGGVRDLETKTLRHVSEAFVEDPLRVLRLARFAARLPDFSVARETMALLKEMVSSGETDHLVAERVLSEISRGLMQRDPVRMLDVLLACGFWQRTFPQLEITQALKAALTRAAKEKAPLINRISLLLSSACAENIKELCLGMKLSADTTDAATLFVRFRKTACEAKTAEDFYALFSAFDVLRRPERLETFLLTMHLAGVALNKDLLGKLSSAYKEVPLDGILKDSNASKNTKSLAEKIHEARLNALKKVLL